ncbi:MAG: hypothetical protein SF029_25315 [bacterium]|nr:hypothetical protein [bacterium]
MIQNTNDTTWKSRSYMLGAIGGLLFGLLSAYLFNRTAEEEITRNGGKIERIPTAQLLSLVLAAISVARQVSEVGKNSSRK